MFKDYYKILGFENNKATDEEIRKSFREKAKKYHPDIASNNEFSDIRFKEVNEAYNVLSKEYSRKKYDRTWVIKVGFKKRSDNIKKEEGSFLNNFVNIFLGNMPQSKSTSKSKGIPIKGDNIETEVEVSISEACLGAKKSISLKTIEGKLKSFKVNIPIGIRNGEKIIFHGQGKVGINGGKNGDLFIKVIIKDDDIFKLKGVDIYTDLLITPWEAILGTKAIVKTIQDEICVVVPKGIQTGEGLVIKTKGYPNVKGNSGDFIAKIKVVVPKNPTPEEIKVYEKLKKISDFNPRNV